MAKPKARVLIAGAGFGGLWAARALADEPVDVTLIDRNNFHTFLPLLYQVGAAELEPFSIARPVRTIIRGQENLDFLHARIRDVDLEGKLVRTDRGVHGYDYLVIALGTVAFDFGVPGARDHAFPLKTIEDGITLRCHILARFEAAMHEPDRARREEILRFLVIGGGPTGVEFAGALSELIRGPLRGDYPEVVEDASIELIEAADRLLGAFPEHLGAYAARRLERMGVQVRLASPVARVDGDGVRLGGEDDGGALAARTVVWTAGVQGAPELRDSGLAVRRDGGVTVLPTLQAESRPEVFVVGDLARIEGREEPLPMLAQVAMQQGEHAAAAIAALRRGDSPEPFRYDDKGEMAVIGRNAAVARLGGDGPLGGRTFTGFPAWLLWLLIHLVHLIGFRNRLAVLLNWAWGYAFFERAARLLLPIRARTPQWPETRDGG